jgi:hypothetical protein
MEDRSVEAFFDRLDEERRIIALVLHELIMGAEPSITTKMRYRIPFYDHDTWFCYINPLKRGGVELCFLYADRLDDPSGLLDFKGRKMVGGITCDDVDRIPFEAVDLLLRQAITMAQKQ